MIFKLLWPEICPFCGKVSAEGICTVCEHKLKKRVITQPVCMKCGKPVRRNEQEYCRDCTGTTHHYDRGRALWLHKTPVNHSIYQFKYHNQRVFAKYYAQEMVRQFEKIIDNWQPDLIVPIPLHIRRKRKRGYNQSLLLAKEIGKLTGIPVDGKILKRIRYTDPQKILDHRLRKHNLYNAFQVSKDIGCVRTVVLIDDIYTTGNTIDEAARKLKEAGVEKVYFLTVSIGQGY